MIVTLGTISTCRDAEEGIMNILMSDFLACSSAHLFIPHIFNSGVNPWNIMRWVDEQQRWWTTKQIGMILGAYVSDNVFDVHEHVKKLVAPLVISRVSFLIQLWTFSP